MLDRDSESRHKSQMSVAIKVKQLVASYSSRPSRRRPLA